MIRSYIRCLLWFTWFVTQETQMTVVATSKPVVLYFISPMHVPVPPLVHPVSTISNESDVLINDEQNCPILWEIARWGDSLLQLFASWVVHPLLPCCNMYFVSEKRPDSVQLLSLILVCAALVCKDFQINCCLHYDVLLLLLLLQVSSE